MVATPRKVDINQTYPCPNPLCRCGTLQPITLTQAWGCFHCQQIFAPTSDSLAIESLTRSSQTARCSWYWQGRYWVKVGSPSSVSSAVGKLLFIVAAVVVIALLIVLR